VLDGLKLGNDALKKANEMFSIDEIEQIMEDTAEAIAKQKEIDDLLSGQLTQVTILPKVTNICNYKYL
jgi:charged multivesicular body protein 6